MPEATVSVTPDDPRRVANARALGRQLNAAVESLRSRPRGRWYLIGTFPVRKEQAYWFRTRLKATFAGQGYEFLASAKGGVGKIHCRLPEAK